ncbi:hypothetical protein SpCBS45565_g08043 [Spizellomyces sp. 'palustris']|nr:hypothetical protein SpCBS45565_g08043 [Spizellomyces sp. 'palustris']
MAGRFFPCALLFLLVWGVGSDHWMSGDPGTHCYTYTNDNPSNPGTTLPITGVTIHLSNLSDPQPVETKPVVARMRVSFDARFYSENNGIVRPMPNSSNFTDLCLRRVTPDRRPACSGDRASMTADNWYVLLAFLQRQIALMKNPVAASHTSTSISAAKIIACDPWYYQPNAHNLSIPYVLATATEAQVGFPEQDFSVGPIPLAADVWTVIGHFTVGNIQCASGTRLTVLPAPSPSPSVANATTTESQSSTSLPTYGIILITLGAVLLTLLLGAGIYALTKRNGKKQEKRFAIDEEGASTVDESAGRRDRDMDWEWWRARMWDGEPGMGYPAHSEGQMSAASQQPVHSPSPIQAPLLAPLPQQFHSAQQQHQQQQQQQQPQQQPPFAQQQSMQQQTHLPPTPPGSPTPPKPETYEGGTWAYILDPNRGTVPIYIPPPLSPNTSSQGHYSPRVSPAVEHASEPISERGSEQGESNVVESGLQSPPPPEYRSMTEYGKREV